MRIRILRVITQASGKKNLMCNRCRKDLLGQQEKERVSYYKNKYVSVSFSQAYVSKLSLQPSMIGNYAAILIKLFITPEYVSLHQEQCPVFSRDRVNFLPSSYCVLDLV